MSEAKRGTELLHTDPVFIVANLARSVSFYQQYLGFEVRYLAPDQDPFFAVGLRGFQVRDADGDVLFFGHVRE